MAVLVLIGASACAGGTSQKALTRSSGTEASVPSSTTSSVPRTTSTTARATTTTTSPKAASTTTMAPAPTVAPTTTTGCPPGGCGPPTTPWPPSSWVTPRLALGHATCAPAGDQIWHVTLRITFQSKAYGIWSVGGFNGWTGPSDVPAGYAATVWVDVAIGGPIPPGAPPIPDVTGISFNTQWGTKWVPTPTVHYPCS
jgi:hypothetical protein